MSAPALDPRIVRRAARALDALAEALEERLPAAPPPAEPASGPSAALEAVLQARATTTPSEPPTAPVDPITRGPSTPAEVSAAMDRAFAGATATDNPASPSLPVPPRRAVAFAGEVSVDCPGGRWRRGGEDGEEWLVLTCLPDPLPDVDWQAHSTLLRIPVTAKSGAVKHIEARAVTPPYRATYGDFAGDHVLMARPV